MKCPNCSQELDQGSEFCGNCGQQIMMAPPAQQQVEQPVIMAQPQATSINPLEQPQSQMNDTLEHPTEPPIVNQGQNPIYTNQNQQYQNNYIPNNNQPVANQYQAPEFQNYAGAPAPSGGGKAITSLILGICSLPGALIPIAGLIIGILSIVFGSISLHSLRRKFAIAGIIIGIIGILLSLAVWVWSYNLLSTGTKASQDFLKYAKNKNIDQAYEITTDAFKTKTDKADFKVFITAIALLDIETEKPKSYKVSTYNGKPLMDFEYVGSYSGKKVNIKIQMLRPDGQWLVQSVDAAEEN